jgi:hypothetical protein
MAVCDAEDSHPTNDCPHSLFHVFDSIMWWLVNAFVTLVGLWPLPLHVVFCSVYFVMLWDCQDDSNVEVQITMVINGCKFLYDQMASWWFMLRKILQWMCTCVVLCKFWPRLLAGAVLCWDKLLLSCYLGTKYLTWTTQLDTLCKLLKFWSAIFNSRKVIGWFCLGQLNIWL